VKESEDRKKGGKKKTDVAGIPVAEGMSLKRCVHG
jgi:hypothetical protein